MIKPDASEIDIRYLILNEYDKKYPIRINSIGHKTILKQKKKNSYNESIKNNLLKSGDKRVVKEYMLIFLVEGDAVFTSSSTTAGRFSDGMAVLIFPDEWYSFQLNKDKDWRAFYIGFEGEIFDMLKHNSFISTSTPILNVGVSENLIALFNMAIQTAKSDRIGVQQSVAGMVMNIITEVLSLSKNYGHDTNSIDRKIQQAKVIMNDKIYDNVDPQDIADKLNLSYSWFRKIFRDYTGYAPVKYYQELKLRRAKELLVNTSFSVKEISFRLNFNSIENFVTLFKKRTGMTPLEYRKLGRGAFEKVQIEPEEDVCS